MVPTFLFSLEVFLTKLSDTFEKMRRIEGRVANDQVKSPQLPLCMFTSRGECLSKPFLPSYVLFCNSLLFLWCQDLKLSDCLRYHMRDTNAAKDLLYRSVMIKTYQESNWEIADVWGAWPTTKRPTRILTWPEPETKMLPWLKTS